MSELFGKYELVRKIATGGMAEVFLARLSGEDFGFSRRVAIKRMFPHMTDDPEARKMFFDEAKIAASLSHPNIVQVWEIGQEGSHLYLVMEYIHGRDVRRILDAARGHKPLPIHMGVSIVASAAAGLHHAHFQRDEAGNPMNVVHRDVSPQNVLVAADGHVKVCDFGIAKAEDRMHHTKQGQFKGKISYMSPEQFETSKVDHRADIYGLGVLLYEVTTGQRLYDADTDLEMLRMLSTGDFRIPSEVVPGFPSDLEQIILKAIARDPDDRFQSAQDLQLALEAWMDANASRVSALQLGRFMQGLFPELADPNSRTAERPALQYEHVEKTIVTNPDVFEATIMGDAPKASEWDVEDHTIITNLDAGETAEMDAFSRDALREELERQQTRDVKPAPLNLPKPLLPAFSAPLSTASEVTPLMSSLAATAPIAQPAPAPAPTPVAQPAPASAPVAQPAPAPAPVAHPAPAPAPVAQPAPAPAPVAQPAPAPAPVAQPAPVPANPRPASASHPTNRPPAGFQPPPGAGPKPAAKPARAPAASAPSDFSADVPMNWKPQRNKGPIFMALGVAVLIILGLAVLYIARTSESQITKDAEATRIDPALLEDEPIPVPKLVSVKLQSNPPGAVWVVNGLLANTRGDEVEVYEGVENDVTAILAGHKSTHVRIKGNPSGSPHIVDLQPNPSTKIASLAVISEPPEAVIYLNGEEAGRTPATLQGLATGVEHHVELRREGRFGYAGLIELVPDSENLVSVELPAVDSAYRTFVEVIFGAIPRNSMVRVNGELIAQTPFRKNFPRGSVLEVSFDEPDHAESTRVAALDHVAVMEFRQFLEPMTREKGTIEVSVEPSGGTLYIGANAYGTGIKKLELKEGKYPVVVEHLGQRLKATLEVVPKTHTPYVLNINGDTINVTTP